jgi:hypothetical protein
MCIGACTAKLGPQIADRRIGLTVQAPPLCGLSNREKTHTYACLYVCMHVHHVCVYVYIHIIYVCDGRAMHTWLPCIVTLIRWLAISVQAFSLIDSLLEHDSWVMVLQT